MNTQDKNTLYRLLSPKELIAFEYEAIIIDGTGQVLTVPEGAVYAELRLESDVTSGVATRYLMTGNSPSASDGMALNNLDFFDISGGTNLVNFQIIESASGTHTLHVQYYK
jgi:hypothetical protein